MLGSTSTQHWINVSCLLGIDAMVSCGVSGAVCTDLCIWTGQVCPPQDHHGIRMALSQPLAGLLLLHLPLVSRSCSCWIQQYNSTRGQWATTGRSAGWDYWILTRCCLPLVWLHNPAAHRIYDNGVFIDGDILKPTKYDLEQQCWRLTQAPSVHP